MLQKDFALQYRLGKVCLPGNDIVRFTNFAPRKQSSKTRWLQGAKQSLDCIEDQEQPYVLELLKNSLWTQTK